MAPHATDSPVDSCVPPMSRALVTKPVSTVWFGLQPVSEGAPAAPAEPGALVSGTMTSVPARMGRATSWSITSRPTTPGGANVGSDEQATAASPRPSAERAQEAEAQKEEEGIGSSGAVLGEKRPTGGRR